MNQHVHGHTELTKNQSLVMSALQQSEGPLSAYSILDRLRDHGVRAPLQVYRALDKLVEYGLVHRLESLNAFVACDHPDCGEHESVAFMICEKCGQVEELGDDRLTSRLSQLASEAGFALKKTTLELRGLCAACQAN